MFAHKHFGGEELLCPLRCGGWTGGGGAGYPLTCRGSSNGGYGRQNDVAERTLRNSLSGCDVRAGDRQQHQHCRNAHFFVRRLGRATLPCNAMSADLRHMYTPVIGHTYAVRDACNESSTAAAAAACLCSLWQPVPHSCTRDVPLSMPILRNQ